MIWPGVGGQLDVSSSYRGGVAEWRGWRVAWHTSVYITAAPYPLLCPLPPVSAPYPRSPPSLPPVQTRSFTPGGTAASRVPRRHQSCPPVHHPHPSSYSYHSLPPGRGSWPGYTSPPGPWYVRINQRPDNAVTTSQALMHLYRQRPETTQQCSNVTDVVKLLKRLLHCYNVCYVPTTPATLLQRLLRCYNVFYVATTSVTLLLRPLHCYNVRYAATTSLTLLQRLSCNESGSKPCTSWMDISSANIKCSACLLYV